jgi:hypothetical protein
LSRDVWTATLLPFQNGFQVQITFFMLVKAIDSLFPVGKPVGGKRWLNFL